MSDNSRTKFAKKNRKIDLPLKTLFKSEILIARIRSRKGIT